jgi:hypothetical protein
MVSKVRRPGGAAEDYAQPSMLYYEVEVARAFSM